MQMLVLAIERWGVKEGGGGRGGGGEKGRSMGGYVLYNFFIIFSRVSYGTLWLVSMTSAPSSPLPPLPPHDPGIVQLPRQSIYLFYLFYPCDATLRFPLTAYFHG